MVIDLFHLVVNVVVPSSAGALAFTADSFFKTERDMQVIGVKDHLSRKLLYISASPSHHVGITFGQTALIGVNNETHSSRHRGLPHVKLMLARPELRVEFHDLLGGHILHVINQVIVDDEVWRVFAPSLDEEAGEVKGHLVEKLLTLGLERDKDGGLAKGAKLGKHDGALVGCARGNEFKDLDSHCPLGEV